MTAKPDLWAQLSPQDTAGLRREFVDLPNGVRLHVVVRGGDSPPIICLHGIWDWWGYWRALLASGIDAIDRRELVMVDLRGHGASSGAGSYTVTGYASDIAELADALSIPRMSLLGHSLGALTALLAAAAMPGRVDSLVLEDPPLPLPGGASDMFRGVYEMKCQPIEAIAGDFRAWRPWTSEEQALESAMCLAATEDGVFQATFDGSFSDTGIPAPGVTIQAPVLVIQAGVADQRAFRAGGEELLGGVATDLKVVTIANTTHTVLRDDRQGYCRVLGEFLADGG